MSLWPGQSKPPINLNLMVHAAKWLYLLKPVEYLATDSTIQSPYPGHMFILLG